MRPRLDVSTARRLVRAWLFIVASLVLATILVGGATRLTQSGLSIVEWRPVTGTVPPLNESQWQAEFDKYKTIPQYREINRGMSLEEFKTIYWWEWAHRLLGRAIGVAFLLPFVWFLWRGWIEPGLKSRLWAIFALGALQGGVGWWMVASGLAHRVDVSQYRLAVHLTLAVVILAAILWTAERLSPRPSIEVRGRVRAGAIALLVLVVAQIYLGALVAGLHAGVTFNTWPLINGRIVPPDLLAMEPAWRNIFENALAVQFNHRMVAYALWLAALMHAIDLARTEGRGSTLVGALVLAILITLQVAVGVLTLIHNVPISLALVHQGMAIVVLAVAVTHAARLTTAKGEASAARALSPTL